MSGWERLTVCGLTGALLVASPAIADTAVPELAETVVANDNTRAAGAFEGGTITIRLRAAAGTWRPQRAAGS